MANYVSYSNAQELMTAIGLKLRALNGAYVIKGNSTFAALPANPTIAENGYVYNVTNDFTTDSRFIEGAGKKYPAGTNVVIFNNGTTQTPDMKFDVIGSFVDVDGLEDAIQAVSDMITDEFDATEAYTTGDVVVYQGNLYKFKADHAAGAWNSAQVDEVTVVDLIQSSEPDELTAAQISTLTALL